MSARSRSRSREGKDAKNPLLETKGLPRFQSIDVKHVKPAMEAILKSMREDFKSLEAALPKTSKPDYEGVVESLEKLRHPLSYSWGVVSHLNNVKNSDALREVHQAVQPEVVKAEMELSQSRVVFDALGSLETSALPESRQRIVESALRDMRLSGVDLEGSAKEEFKTMRLRLAELGTSFGNNLLDSTKAFEMVLTELKDVEGLPTSALAAAAQSYNQAQGGKSEKKTEATSGSGPWRLTLDMPSYLPALKHLKSSELREKLYRAFISRASTGKMDNGPLITEILKLRKRASALLGFKDYASESLAKKMAPDLEAVRKLTGDLFAVARPAAEKELQELQDFANKKGSALAKGYDGKLQLWDVAYWTECLKQEKYAYDEEALRPYFSLPKVLKGMFGIASKLFGVDIAQDDNAAERWHPDVMFFKVQDAGKDIASFFLDPYARPGEKRGGAWMDDCLGRSKAVGTKPVAYLNCNGSPPVGTKPSLMTFSEAETLFHEFGHGLQHMLTHVEDGECAGINNVEWDAVELPSQFMENWLYHKPTVDSFAVHFETGEPLPSDVFEKIKGSRIFMAASMMLRQLQLGDLDMKLHSEFDPEGPDTFLNVQRRVADKYQILPPLEEDRFLCSFKHIFAGGYAAGYYSYKWAEVLSADAFAAFEEAGLEDEAALRSVGRRFRDTVLGCGGGRHPSKVYRDFRGKDATVDALLYEIGAALWCGHWDRACQLLLTSNRGASALAAASAAFAAREYAQGLEMLPTDRSCKGLRALAMHLLLKKDPLEALRRAVPAVLWGKLLATVGRVCWNRAVAARLSELAHQPMLGDLVWDQNAGEPRPLSHQDLRTGQWQLSDLILPLPRPGEPLLQGGQRLAMEAELQELVPDEDAPADCFPLDVSKILPRVRRIVSIPSDLGWDVVESSGGGVVDCDLARLTARADGEPPSSAARSQTPPGLALRLRCTLPRAESAEGLLRELTASNPSEFRENLHRRDHIF
ncbi:putative cytosolic oligopeptidase A [Symbiodinium microadriaticum]|uniref:oligopeptidase A n=1 Tax=Symbiodinium microadriaticum TaxID=2951 RepID=A0A1Q9CRZ6_SYMMI|nr:putative cytosolic oligopeptidase A [Symbiodinium microadriaticum]